MSSPPYRMEYPQARVFRPRLKFWLLEVLPPCLLVGAVIAYPYLTERKFAWIPAGYLSSLCFLFVLLPALRTRVVTTTRAITGYVGLRNFQLDWANIVLADLRVADSAGPFLVLAAGQELLQLPVAALDVQTIWEVVQARVPPEAVGERAYQQLPAYQELVEQNTEWAEASKPRRMREVQPLKAILVVMGIAFFTLGAIEIWSGSAWLRWISMGIAVVGLLPMSAVTGVVEVDAVAISSVNPLAVVRAPWEQLERVVIAGGGDFLHLYGTLRGKKRRLSLLGPAWWPSKERPAVIAMLQIICRQRGIDFQLQQK